jgi:hypothetical protein
MLVKLQTNRRMSSPTIAAWKISRTRITQVLLSMAKSSRAACEAFVDRLMQHRRVRTTIGWGPERDSTPLRCSWSKKLDSVIWTEYRDDGIWPSLMHARV